MDGGKEEKEEEQEGEDGGRIGKEGVRSGEEYLHTNTARGKFVIRGGSSCDPTGRWAMAIMVVGGCVIWWEV